MRKLMSSLVLLNLEFKDLRNTFLTWFIDPYQGLYFLVFFISNYYVHHWILAWPWEVLEAYWLRYFLWQVTCQAETQVSCSNDWLLSWFPHHWSLNCPLIGALFSCVIHTSFTCSLLPTFLHTLMDKLGPSTFTLRKQQLLCVSSTSPVVLKPGLTNPTPLTRGFVSLCCLLVLLWENTYLKPTGLTWKNSSRTPLT